MSYDSLHADSKIFQEDTGFTQISNNVINGIKHGDAFLVWAYIYSKSGNWKVIKQHIKNHFGFGDKKLKQIFAYLKRAKLISYVQRSCANGRFAQSDIRVHNGKNFDKNQTFTKKAPQVPKTAPAVHRTSGNDELLNKEITKEIKIRKNKKQSLSASSAAQPKTLITEKTSSGFDDFWKIYPVKRNKKRAKDIWKRKRYDEIAPFILEDIQKRIKNDMQWHNKAFIPHASTYLLNERWEDEIIQSQPMYMQETSKNTIRSTIKEWAPGNPDYDRVNAI